MKISDFYWKVRLVSSIYDDFSAYIFLLKNILGVEKVIENLQHESFDEIIEKVNSAGLNWKAGHNFNQNYKPHHVAGLCGTIMGENRLKGNVILFSTILKILTMTANSTCLLFKSPE